MVDVVIVAAKRTPMGDFQGELSPLSVTDLGAVAVKGALESSSISADRVEEVIMGIVLSAGARQAPARQVGIGAGIPTSTPATAVCKLCGSGMQAIINGYNQIALGRNEIIVAGGMESMSNAPYLSLGSRFGIRLGHTKLIDHMFYDGLEDAYENGRLMGSFAEDCAKKYNFSRSAQDEYAITSLTRALSSTENMRDEIEPVKVKSRKSETIIDTDQGPRCAKADKITSLRPAFAKDGTITAANSSSISDGAAALVLTSSKIAEEKDSQVARARVVGYAGHAQEPGWFTTAPVSAAKKLLSQIGWNSTDVDLWEVNEAFAVVAMAFMHDLGIDHDKVNVNGGACALGHPIGASGARILVTLLHALENRNLKRGVAAVCIGGGEALAVAIERD